jgi:hypothetical protein
MLEQNILFKLAQAAVVAYLLVLVFLVQQIKAQTDLVQIYLALV